MKLWIARDKYGLWLFETKPYIDNDMFTCDSNVYRIDSDLFPEVTFENSPQEVELKLCNSIEKIDITKHNIKTQPCVLTNDGIDTNVIKFD